MRGRLRGTDLLRLHVKPDMIRHTPNTRPTGKSRFPGKEGLLCAANTGPTKDDPVQHSTKKNR